MTYKIRKIHLQETFTIIFLSIILIISLKFFQSTLFEVLFFKIHAIYLFFVLLFLIAYVFNSNIKKYSKVIVYYLVLMAVIPFYSAYCAKVSFGQPLIYGILAERGWLVIGTSIIIYYYLTTRVNFVRTLESTFLLLTWVSLLFFLFYKLTFDPSNLDSSQKFVEMTLSRGLRFKFPSYFITFGTLYYFVRYMTHKIPHDLLFLLIFIMYTLFFIQGRTYTITLILTLLIYYFRNYSLSLIVIKMIKITAGIILLIFIIQIISNDFLVQTKMLYKQMFMVLTGQVSDDPSANVRIYTGATVLNYFKENPLSIIFGVGLLSHQWNEGFKSVFGYFYPSDIGILGGWFLYGFIGTIFISILPFIFTIKRAFKKLFNTNVYIVSMQYLLIFYIILFIQGSYFFSPVAYTIPLFILIGFNKIQYLQNEK